MSRSVLFDTETTGLDPLNGDRVIEIAALELLNGLPTGRQLHILVDPERDIPEGATRIHGFTRSHLIGKPLFGAVASDILDFFGDSPLVAHNAPFDFSFLDAELTRLRMPQLGRHRMIDTLGLAKTRFPGLPNSLDALCRRFGVDLTERTTHNALLDCKLLAQVYIELTGGRQRALLLSTTVAKTLHSYAATGPRRPVHMHASAEEIAAHQCLFAALKNPIWLDVL